MATAARSCVLLLLSASRNQCCRLAQEVLSRVDPNESFLKVLPQQVRQKEAQHNAASRP